MSWIPTSYNGDCGGGSRLIPGMLDRCFDYQGAPRGDPGGTGLASDDGANRESPHSRCFVRRFEATIDAIEALKAVQGGGGQSRRGNAE
jgi:hypothetical protein